MPVSISIPTLVVEVLLFLFTVWFMEWLVFNPVRRAWAEREHQIETGLAASSEGRDEAVHAREEVHRILVEARRRAQGEIDEATAAGNRTRDELVTRATAEFRRLVEEAQRQIAAERERSAEALRSRIIDIAVLAASRVTGLSFNRPEVRELAATVVQREGLS